MHRQTVLVQMSFFSLDRLFSVLCGLEPSVDLRFFAVSRQTDRKTDHVRLFFRQTHRPTDRQSHFFLKQNPFRIEFGSLSVGGPCVNAAPLGTTNPHFLISDAAFTSGGHYHREMQIWADYHHRDTLLSKWQVLRLREALHHFEGVVIGAVAFSVARFRSDMELDNALGSALCRENCLKRA